MGQTPAMDDEQLRERPVSRRTIFRGRLLTVHADEVTTPSGLLATREIVEHPGAVAIVATDGDGRILLVRQWRHAVAKALWEIPAGTCEPSEQPEATARRELAEETGYDAAVWESLGGGPTAPGYSGEVLHFFAARQLTPGEAHTDPGETLVARLFTPVELAGLLADGGVDLKTLAGLALAGFTVKAAR
jgi:ADP-ribose pyrophosphatase